MGKPSSRAAILACTTVALLSSSCGAQVSDKYVIANQPASLQAIPGSDLKKVTLTDEAMGRVGIETALVAGVPDSLVVPSGALWMDVQGVYWVYTNPEPNVFVRHAVTVEDDDGREALLSSGPPPGSVVVAVGVPELYGEEVGVGK